MKKIFGLLLLFFLLEFAFWPAVFGLKFTPAFLLAFLVALLGVRSNKELFFWFLFSGFLIGCFSPWPWLISFLSFSLTGLFLFSLEKIFLWQSRGTLFNAFIFLAAKIFFDFSRWIFLQIYFKLIDGRFFSLESFFLKDYALELVGFIFLGELIFVWMVRRKNRFFIK